MKLHKILLCTAAILTSFGVSLGLLEIVYYINSAFQPETPTKIAEIKPERNLTVVYQQPEVSRSVPAADPTESKEYCEFSPEGDYTIFGSNPKGFEDFETLTVVTTNYDEVKNENFPVEPVGMLYLKKEFKFSWIKIKDKQISFVTVTRRGVSYQFDGRYVDEKVKTKVDGEEYEQTIPLKGRLIKWRNGIKIAEAKVKFIEMCGC